VNGIIGDERKGGARGRKNLKEYIKNINEH
jgi:hypothetical protein